METHRAGRLFLVRLALVSLLSIPSSTQWAQISNISISATANSSASGAVKKFQPQNPYGTFYDNRGFIHTPSDPSVASGCSSLYISQWSLYSESNPLFFSTRDTSEIYTGVVTTNAGYAFNFPFTPSSPCCYSCTLFGGNVKVYYWPTPVPTPHVSVLVDTNGFTFTSPSIYVAFQTLNATNLCGLVGSVIPRTTIAFRPEDLSTSIALFVDERGYASGFEDVASASWSAFTYKDLQDNCELVTVSYASFDNHREDGGGYADLTTYYNTAVAASLYSARISAGNFLFGYQMYTYSYNPCSPLLSVPTQVFSIDSRWRTCLAGISAFYDPPHALVSANGLLPVSITSVPVSGASSTTAAQAGLAPDPAIAASTGKALTTASASVQDPPDTKSTSSSIGVPVATNSPLPVQTFPASGPGDSLRNTESAAISSVTNGDPLTTKNTRNGKPDPASTIVGGGASTSASGTPSVSITYNPIQTNSAGLITYESSTIPLGNDAKPCSTCPLVPTQSTSIPSTYLLTPGKTLVVPPGLANPPSTFSTDPSVSPLPTGLPLPTTLTLLPGSAVTMEGAVFSLPATGGTADAIIVVSASQTGTAAGLGGLIASAMGLTPLESASAVSATSVANGTGYAIVPFLGAASALGGSIDVRVVLGIGICAVLMVM